MSGARPKAGPGAAGAKAAATRLQRAQRDHDERYHQDILALDTDRRLKHMTLHNAKYTGRFLLATETGDSALFGQSLTDAFVISLATANALVQNLAAGVPPALRGTATLHDIGRALANHATSSNSFACAFATHTATMAKACESLDHVEDFPFRRQLTEANQAIFHLLLAEAAARQIDLESAYAARIAELERRSPQQQLFYHEPE